MKKNLFILGLIAIMFAFSANSLYAQQEGFNFTGRLMDAGTPANGDYTMSFQVGTWNSGDLTVPVTEGYYSVFLQMPDDVITSQLNLTVTPTVNGTELTAQPIKNVPGAIKSQYVVKDSYTILDANTTEGNYMLGRDAGTSLTTGSDNVLIGQAAGWLSTSATSNTFVGHLAGRDCANGSQNVAIGSGAGSKLTSGIFNTFVGDDAGNNITTGGRNVMLGQGVTGSVGSQERCVFIGYTAGGAITDSYRLAIDCYSTSTPLIYGEFDNDKVIINGDLTVTGTINGAKKTQEYIELQQKYNELEKKYTELENKVNQLINEGGSN